MEADITKTEPIWLWCIVMDCDGLWWTVIRLFQWKHSIEGRRKKLVDPWEHLCLARSGYSGLISGGRSAEIALWVPTSSLPLPLPLPQFHVASRPGMSSCQQSRYHENQSFGWAIFLWTGWTRECALKIVSLGSKTHCLGHALASSTAKLHDLCIDLRPGSRLVRESRMRDSTRFWTTRGWLPALFLFVVKRWPDRVGSRHLNGTLIVACI